MATKASCTRFLQQQQGEAPFWTKEGRRRSLNDRRMIIYFLKVRIVREDAWARHVAKVDNNMKDDAAHFALKLDLINYIWEQHGNQ